MEIKTLQQVKEDYAATFQFADWDHCISYHETKHPELVRNIMENIHEMYCNQFL